MQIIKQYLVMSFYNAKGNEVKLTVASPKPNVSQSDLNAIMDKVITLGAFCGGEDVNLIKKKSVAYLQTEQHEISLG